MQPATVSSLQWYQVKHLQQEGEAGVAVGDVTTATVLGVDERHDDLAQHR